LSESSAGATIRFMQRIVIVGPTGAGKTSLAQQLTSRLHLPAVDLDALFWGPNWQPVETSSFRTRVDAITAQERWLVGGNYSVARDLIWPRADTLIWLDYALPIVFVRLLRRTVRRIVTHEELFAGNRENWRSQFASRDSLFLWLLKSQPRQRREYPHLLAEPDHRHLQVLQFRTPHALQHWLVEVGRGYR
jgi:adenylate kinase family enzyme